MLWRECGKSGAWIFALKWTAALGWIRSRILSARERSCWSPETPCLATVTQSKTPSSCWMPRERRRLRALELKVDLRRLKLDVRDDDLGILTQRTAKSR